MCGDRVCGAPSTGAGEGSDCRPGRRRGRQRHLSLARTGRSRLHATRSRRAVGLSVCPTGMGAPPAADSAGRRGALPLSSLPNEGTAPRDTVLASHRSLRATEKEIPVSREDGLGSPMGDLVTAEGQGPARGPEAEPTTAVPPATWPLEAAPSAVADSLLLLPLPLVTLLHANAAARAHDEHRAPAGRSVSRATQTTETGPCSRDSQASRQPQRTAP